MDPRFVTKTMHAFLDYPVALAPGMVTLRLAREQQHLMAPAQRLRQEAQGPHRRRARNGPAPRSPIRSCASASTESSDRPETAPTRCPAARHRSEVGRTDKHSTACWRNSDNRPSVRAPEECRCPVRRGRCSCPIVRLHKCGKGRIYHLRSGYW